MARPDVTRLVLMVALLCGACGDGDQPLATPQAADAEAVVTSDAGSTDDTDGSSSNCRWLGYGIGPLGAGQCSTEHLGAHSWQACMAFGGQAKGQRNVVDQCSNQQADEVQMFCCFADGELPTDGPTATVVPLPEHLTNDALASREVFVAAAADTCAQSSHRLGDWSVLYGADGATPEQLRFMCY